MQAAISLDVEAPPPPPPAPWVEPLRTVKLIFAANLRRILREQGRLSKDLAAHCGVAPPTVTQWKNAETFPTGDNLELIRSFFNVPIAELFREDVLSERDTEQDAQTALRALAKVFGLDLVKPEENPAKPKVKKD